MTKQDDQEAEALRERLRHQLTRSEMSYTELFEDSAERFYRKTGLMAPGKSVPLEMWTSDNEERRNASWAEWQAAQKAEWQADLRAALSALDGLAKAEQERDTLKAALATSCKEREQLQKEHDELLARMASPGEGNNPRTAATIQPDSGLALTNADAVRTVRSLAAMLGWLNVPPRSTLEADLRAVKARADHAGAMAAAADTERENANHWRARALAAESCVEMVKCAACEGDGEFGYESNGPQGWVSTGRCDRCFGTGKVAKAREARCVDADLLSPDGETREQLQAQLTEACKERDEARLQVEGYCVQFLEEHKARQQADRARDDARATVADLQAVLATTRDDRERAEAERDVWKVDHAYLAGQMAEWRSWGIVEIASMNPNVSSYMDHWEGRATKAEASNALLLQQIERLQQDNQEKKS
jgi:hypothetical protein